MRKLLVIAVALCFFVGGRLSHRGVVDAEGAGGDLSACRADRTLHSIDANDDGGVDISDAIHILQWLFLGGTEPQACLDEPPDLQARIAELEAELAACQADLAACQCLSTTENLGFNRDYLDLDTGTVERDVLEEPDNDAWDLRVAYNSDRPIHAVIFQNRITGVEIAHLVGRDFCCVTAADVAGASFGTGLVDVSFDASRVILIRTDEGRVFKLGNPVESAFDNGLTFDYAELVSACPATTENLGFSDDYLDLDTGTVERDVIDLSGPQNDGWDLKVAYHSLRPVHAVILQHQSARVEIAHLENRDFCSVTAADVAGASFGTGLVDVSFDASRVILIRTDEGRVFKLGHPVESAFDNGLTFDYAEL